MLNDKLIRQNLINYLQNKTPSPKAIIQELHIENGRAIADVVTAYNHLHCYEIKGETDSINRIHTQASFYNSSFSKITLVTTKNHVTWALKNAPHFWGILLVDYKNDMINFKYIRKTMLNEQFKKQDALMMLWKEELLMAASLFNIKMKRSSTRMEIAETLSKSINKIDLLITLQSLVSQRSHLRKAM